MTIISVKDKKARFLETVEILSAIDFYCSEIKFIDINQLPLRPLYFSKNRFEYFYVVHSFYKGEWFGASTERLVKKVAFSSVFDSLPPNDKDVIIFNLDIFG
jgi:hypothetical protein